MCWTARLAELLRANPYVTVNWASHIDMETGRPVENASRNFVERISRVTDFAGPAWRP